MYGVDFSKCAICIPFYRFNFISHISCAPFCTHSLFGVSTCNLIYNFYVKFTPLNTQFARVHFIHTHTHTYSYQFMNTRLKKTTIHFGFYFKPFYDQQRYHKFQPNRVLFLCDFIFLAHSLSSPPPPHTCREQLCSSIHTLPPV